MKQPNQNILSILDIPVSYFPSVRQTKSGSTVSLLQLLTSTKHREKIERLRAETNPELQKQLKETLPCYTVSGVFSERSSSGLLHPSGLAAVDLDSIEEYDPLQALEELRKIPYIAYAGLSCRGRRLFCIIPFLYPNEYERHYQRLIKSFNDLGLPMGDSCHKSIAQPRYVSYNTPETVIFNHSAQQYHLLEPERLKASSANKATIIYTKPENAFEWCLSQVNKSISFIENNRHHFILKLVRYCNMKGLEQEEVLKGCLQFSESGFPLPEIKSIIKYVYIHQRNSFNSHPFENKSPHDK